MQKLQKVTKFKKMIKSLVPLGIRIIIIMITAAKLARERGSLWKTHKTLKKPVPM